MSEAEIPISPSEVAPKEPAASWAMDRLTGVIRDASSVPVNNKDEIGVPNKPKAKCRKCFGRGYIGRISESDPQHKHVAGHVMPCTCMLPKIPIPSW